MTSPLEDRCEWHVEQQVGRGNTLKIQKNINIGHELDSNLCKNAHLCIRNHRF